MPLARPRAALAALLLAVAALACAEAVAPGSGYVAVRLTDAPFDSVDQVNVFVVRVQARRASADSAAADSAATEPTRGGWVTLAEPARVYDLLALATDTAALGTKALTAGSWAGLRLVIDPSRSNVVLVDGSVLTGAARPGSTEPGIRWPSAATSGLKVLLARPIEVRAGDTTQLVIDFDVAQSFQPRTPSVAGGLEFRPVIRAEAR